jgi:hypothetical protein
MPSKFALEMVMYTCPEREVTRAATLASLAATDWRSDFSIVVDDEPSAPSILRQVRNFWRATTAASQSRASFVVIVEDDLRFNLHLEHNIQSALSPGSRYGSHAVTKVLSLYNSNLGHSVGTQALVATPYTWLRINNALAARHGWPALLTDAWMREVWPVMAHEPSLVQHAAHRSTLAHPDHRAPDFDPEWRA